MAPSLEASDNKERDGEVTIHLLIGSPGAGKTVQGSLLRDRLGIHWISTGRIMREMDDPELNQIINTGALIDDNKACQIAFDAIRESRAVEILLDGFPRTLAQAESLKKFLIENPKYKLGTIFSLDVNKKQAYKRMLGRNRSDDNKQTIEVRFKEFEKITDIMNVLENFKQSSDLLRIDASRSVEEIYSDLFNALIKSGHQAKQSNPST